MKPVLILQHLSGDGPAYLGTWLRRHGIAHEIRNTEAGEAFPGTMHDHAALAILGGEMSANDTLPSLRHAEALIREAMAQDKPVIGHCLGGQLMARALGARVVPSPAPEIGWHSLTVHPHPQALAWFGSVAQCQVFQWHEQAFELPATAVSLASSAACPHQAFAIGAHLAMQFHVEVDEEKLRRWAAEDSAAYRDLRQRHATVQGPSQMCEFIDERLAQQRSLADSIYARWLSPLLASA